MNLDQIQNLKNQAISRIIEAQTKKELEELRIAYLGRKGEISQTLKQIPSLKPEKRTEFGRLANDAKKAIEETLQSQQQSLSKTSNLEKEWLDVTIPRKKPSLGHLHLISQTINEISQIFAGIGFTQRRYPEVEWDWYAFEGLNMPLNHPARDEWETFFVEGLENKRYGRGILTPHTSSGQLREMEKMGKPPIRMLNIAKCYRRQSDPSHAPMFYQFEGLVIDKNIAITNLKGTLDYFVKRYFGPERKTRIRPFHFQFTEPSFEVDVTCILCQGKGCSVCKEGWLELGGAGMIHPQVLKNGGIDSKKYSGFAFGWGVERLLMMKHKIPDIRLLFDNNLQFLSQF